MKTIQVCYEGDIIPDLVDHIINSLDDLLLDHIRDDDADEHKWLMEQMAPIVHKEIIDFLFGE